MFPWKFRNNILAKNITEENKEELAAHYRHYFDRVTRLEIQLADVIEDNKRLLAENNFMLRLINERMDAGPP